MLLGLNTKNDGLKAFETVGEPGYVAAQGHGVQARLPLYSTSSNIKPTSPYLCYPTVRIVSG